MKTSFLILFTTMLAAAHAAPLPPMVAAGIGSGVSAANHVRVSAVPSLTVTAFVPRATLAAPVPVCVAPAPARAR